MSAEAIAVLRKLWGKLEFARVERVIAREPEDVSMIVTERKLGFPKYHYNEKRLSDIPEEERPYAKIYWRHFYGFTDNGIYFQNDDNHGLDCEFNLTMDWSELGNHVHTSTKPPLGAWICGEVVNTPNGKRFKKWFNYGPQFKLLHEMVMNGVTLSEQDLGRELLVKNPSEQPDTFWAIARLVLFDNVQAFVNMLRPSEEWDPHPAHGTNMEPMRHGTQWTLQHRGMYTTNGASQFVHEISYRLNELRWWEEFNRLAEKQGLRHGHPAEGGWCHACDAEGRFDELKAAYSEADY